MADTLDILALRGGEASPLSGSPAADARDDDVSSTGSKKPKPTLTDIIGEPQDLPPGLGPGLTKLQGEKNERVAVAQKEMLQRSESYMRDAEHQYAQTGVSPELYQKWDAQQEFDKRSTDPLQAFGSLGSVFGILASAFTHAPMENALNASAGAMNAIKAGDRESYERAHEAWKQNMDIAFKRHQQEREHYLDAFTLMDNNMRLGEAKVNAALNQYGDEKGLLLAKLGMWPELYKLIDDRNRTAVGAYAAAHELTPAKTQMAVLNNWYKEIDQQYPIAQDPTANAGQKQYALQMWGNINGTDIPHQVLGHKQAEFWQQNKRMMTADEMVETLKEISKAQREGLYGGTARAATNATFESVLADVKAKAKAENREMSEGEARLEADKQIAAAKKAAATSNTSEKTLKTIAETVLAGDTSAMINLSKPDKIKVMGFVSDGLTEQGKTGADQAHATAAYQGERAAQRTAGVSGARTALGATEANEMLQLVHEASDKVPRGKFVPINELLQKAETAVSDPKLAALRAAINSAVSTYSKAISVTGTPTDATRQHSRELLNMAESPEALESVMQIMKKEMLAAIRSPQKVREMIMRGGMGNLEEVNKSLEGASPGAAAPIPSGWGVRVISP